MRDSFFVSTQTMNEHTAGLFGFGFHFCTQPTVPRVIWSWGDFQMALFGLYMSSRTHQALKLRDSDSVSPLYQRWGASTQVGGNSGRK